MESRLSSVGFRLMDLLTTLEGSKFRGLIQTNNVLRTQNDISDYLLQVSLENDIAVEGKVIFYDGEKFLLGRGVTEFNAGPRFRNLRMIEVTDTFQWTRAATTTDPVSGLSQQTGQTSLGTCYANKLGTAAVSDIFHTGDYKFALITNAAVQVNDKLDDLTVTHIESRHGLTYAQVK
jgi:hypothetical protein